MVGLSASAGGVAGTTPPPPGEEEVKVGLWPADMMDFLSRRLAAHLAVRAYPLDPTKLVPPVKSFAQPQKLDSTVPALEGDQLASLVRVNEIVAQRGFGHEQNIRDDDDDNLSFRSSNKLSEQLRSYYRKHLDPSEFPEPKDYEALVAITAAQNKFDEKLTKSFEAAFNEVEGLGYPGVTDPKPRVATKITPVDGLNHRSAITSEIAIVQDSGAVQPVVRLPEDNNGLGYQNLISMIFRLMAFRDAWMRVGKASRGGDAAEFEPLHLVLVEEPEAHLHAQVQ
jgi:predicted ATP-dependent endonuclease of OLD family